MKHVDIIVTILVFFSISATAQTSKVSPQPITEGSEITISYDLTKSFLKGEIGGVCYMWRGYHWEAEDMQLRKKDGSLECRITPPEGTAFICWKFYDRDTVDIGGPAFANASYILTKDGRNMPSAAIGWGFLRGEDTQDIAGIPSLRNVAFERKNLEVTRFWINSELRSNPQELGHVFWFATMALSKDTLTTPEMSRRSLEVVLANGGIDYLDEEGLMKAHQIASLYARDAEMTGTLETKLAEKYPDGQFFREKAARELFISDKSKDFEKRFHKFLRDYPPQKFENAWVEDDMFAHCYGDLFRVYIYEQEMKRQGHDRLYECLKISPRTSLATYFWHLVQIPFDRGDATAAEVYPHAKAIYTELLNRPQNNAEKVWSPREWRQKFYSDHATPWLDYAKILEGVGETAHSMALLDTLSGVFGAKNAAFNDYYVASLRKNGRGAQAMEIIKESLGNNQASPEMLALLKEEFLSGGGKEGDFDAYVHGFKSEDVLRRQREQLLASLIDEPTMLFSLESLDGGKVDMAALKGHVIVLDFWATWCGPCKAAMPGMQMAVDRYKDDPNVDFFFVSTMETSRNFKEQINKFIASKGYDFTVLLDSPDASGKGQAVYSYYAKQFHFSGIPQKMIIDGKGNVRWLATGYYGSPSALADEVGIVIEAVR